MSQLSNTLSTIPVRSSYCIQSHPHLKFKITTVIEIAFVCIPSSPPRSIFQKKGDAPFEFSLLKGESWYFGTHKKRCSTFPNIHTIIISDLFCKQKVCNTVVLIFKFMMDMSSVFLLYSIINTFVMIYRSTFCTYL